jgi:hypothetical protein
MQLISAFKRYLEWEGQLSGLRRWGSAFRSRGS